ncbi:hypothetical protein ACIXNV_07000 [Bacteroides fragilis]
MKAKNEIERWLKDEKFMAFANKRAKEEFFNSENNYIDPQYEEMAEGFEDNDEYVVPMVDYLSYRLHRAKIYRNRRRRERDIWCNRWNDCRYFGSVVPCAVIVYCIPIYPRTC